MRRIVAVSLVLNLLLPWAFVTAVYANPPQFDMDIIFVLDNSGSMRYADRHPIQSPGDGPIASMHGGDGRPRQAWLAATAANLFIDMAAGFDTRVGYVMYTDRIERSRPLTGIYSPPMRRQVQEGIQGMMYGGFTDIAQALNYALTIFENEPDRSRTPAIIFLSDGDVHFPVGGAAAREAGRQAAVVAAQRARDMGIPIHTVGFDFADPMTGEVNPEDEQLLRDITSAANGTIEIAPEAEDLPIVMRNIFAALTEAAVQVLHIETLTGEPQEFAISIPHNSILQASITAMTSQPLDFVYIYSPDGVRLQEREYDYVDGARVVVVEGDYERAVDLNGLYTLLTMRNPAMGEYVLRFQGTEGDTISIDLLSIYDMMLILNPPTPGVGQAVFSWRLEDSAGEAIDDPYFEATLAPTIYATNVETNETTTHPFQVGQTEMTVQLPAGDYSAFLSLEDGNIISNTQTFTVTDIQILPDIVTEPVISVTLWSIIPFLNSRDIPLSDVIDSPMANWPLTASAAMGDWEDYVEFEFDSATGGEEFISLSAVGTGSADDLRVTVTNFHGESVSFLIEVRVLSGLIIIGGLVALILLIVIMLILIGKSKKPFMNDPMGKLHIKMSIPISHHVDPPPEYMISLPRIKGKRTLRELINMNIGIAEPYRLAFERISWFADQAVVSAKTKQLLEIKIPNNPAYQVKVDNMAKPFAMFDKNGGTEIIIGFEDPASGYDQYVIELGNAGLQPDFNQHGGFDSFDSDRTMAAGGPPPQNSNFW